MRNHSQALIPRMGHEALGYSRAQGYKLLKRVWTQIKDDLDETGGDLALTLKNDDLLVVKPEIGFSLNKNFKSTEVKSENFIYKKS